ncbi:pantoate--beta-alanine ligase [Fulvivirga lutea]|uniref:Pantothenate synthetase n=1 Tax=Fulvivirga lutea TaxID=2810512 RepID=A0A974WHF8_9BACT|nr:pantoate--beta-alanine ligase [Fulvivirga lutea]QSE98609.1 pantoate--beta-alanine ligase [Fulvivirga lutea]
MKVFSKISELQHYVLEQKFLRKSIGFVPTMGALHSGHSELLKRAREQSDVVVCSIFVNPAQFNNQEDLTNYPRTAERDIELLKSVGCDALFMPHADEVYRESTLLKFNFGELESVMEGVHRPGHFNGVALIVSKLFHLVNPDFAYFGQKDLQQLTIIKQLVKDLSFPVQIVSVPTVREESGLAKSSRNERLSEDGKNVAAQINKRLKELENQILEGSDFDECRPESIDFLNGKGIEVEYLELVDSETMKAVPNKLNGKSVALCIAAIVEGVRLIDNRIF